MDVEVSGVRQSQPVPDTLRQQSRRPRLARSVGPVQAQQIEVADDPTTELILNGRKPLELIPDAPSPATVRMRGGKQPPPPEPEPDPEPPPSSEPTPELTVSPVSVRSVTITDADLAWDWVRQDTDRGAAFFGAPVQSSLTIHQYVRAFDQRERLGTAMLRTLLLDGVAIGLGAMLPIMVESKVGVLHVYICREMRGHLVDLLPLLLAQVRHVRPDLRLVMLTDRPEWVRLLMPLGFRQQICLIQD